MSFTMKLPTKIHLILSDARLINHMNSILLKGRWSLYIISIDACSEETQRNERLYPKDYNQIDISSKMKLDDKNWRIHTFKKWTWKEEKNPQNLKLSTLWKKNRLFTYFNVLILFWKLENNIDSSRKHKEFTTEPWLNPWVMQKNQNWYVFFHCPLYSVATSDSILINVIHNWRKEPCL